jgi:hypothetical protein
LKFQQPERPPSKTVCFSSFLKWRRAVVTFEESETIRCDWQRRKLWMKTNLPQGQSPFIFRSPAVDAPNQDWSLYQIKEVAVLKRLDKHKTENFTPVKTGVKND